MTNSLRLVCIRVYGWHLLQARVKVEINSIRVHIYLYCLNLKNYFCVSVEFVVICLCQVLSYMRGRAMAVGCGLYGLHMGFCFINIRVVSLPI